MAYTAAPPQTLMGLWRLERDLFRPIGHIVSEARAGNLPGVEPAPHGHGFIVTDHRAALAAMQKAS